jgi:integrase
VGLFKRGSIWWANFYDHGVRFQESTGTSNRKTAEKILHKLKEQANLRRYQITETNPDITFQELSEKFKESNPSAYNLDRLKHLLPFFGKMHIPEISRAKALEYRKERQLEKPELKESTLNRDIGVFRHVLNFGVEQQLIPANPLTKAPMVRERRIKQPVLTISEEQQLLEVSKSHLRNIIIAALDTGMRKGEILSQVWSDIDLERKLLSVSRSKTPEGEGREIPLTVRLFEILNSVVEKSGPVFTYNGEQVLDLKTSWNTAQRKALARHLRFHDLRHTFNTRLMEAGVISDVRKALMGHQDRSVHWGYTHVELPPKREAIAKLEAWHKTQMDTTKP